MSQLEGALKDYAAALTELEKHDSPSRETVLKVLVSRDTLCEELGKQSYVPVAALVEVNDLDSRIKKEPKTITKITQVVNLAECRSILNPTRKAWWWFLTTPQHQWDFFDWLWKTLTIIFLTASFSLTVDISLRFLTGGPDTLGSFVTATQAVLTVLASRSVLTKAGHESIKNTLGRLNIPKHFWEEVNCGLAFSLFLIFVIFRLSLPQIAVLYTNLGDRYIFRTNPPQIVTGPKPREADR